MKRGLISCMLGLVLCALCSLVSSSALADDARLTLQQAKTTFYEANKCYDQKDFAKAFDLYSQLARAGYSTREVLFNAGNSAYRNEQTGEAVLYYRRALKRDPSYNLAHANLAHVQPETNMVAGTGIGTDLAAWFSQTPGLLWAVLAELSFVLLLAAIWKAGRCAPGTEARSAWVGRIVGAIVLLAASGGLLATHSKLRFASGEAVVITDKSISRSGPGENFFQQLELPAGTLVNILGEPQNGWVRFKLLDGRTGFLPSETVEKV